VSDARQDVSICNACSQRVQQRLGVLEVGSVEALDAPAINRRQQLAGRGTLVLLVAFSVRISMAEDTPYLALGLLNFHKDGTIFEDPHIPSGFRNDNGNSLGHRGNASGSHVA
jgi:hypothetical protein